MWGLCYLLFNITRLVIYWNYLFLTKLNTVQYMIYAKHRTIEQLSTKYYTVYTIGYFNTHHFIQYNSVQYSIIQRGAPNTPLLLFFVNYRAAKCTFFWMPRLLWALSEPLTEVGVNPILLFVLFQSLASGY